MSREKKYIVEFWRNDGDWHSIDRDIAPAYMFSAKDDEDAYNLALAYIEVERIGNEDFSIMELAEFRMTKRVIPLDVDKRMKRIVLDEDLEGKVESAEFKSLKEAIFPYRENGEKSQKTCNTIT